MKRTVPPETIALVRNPVMSFEIDIYFPGEEFLTSDEEDVSFVAFNELLELLLRICHEKVRNFIGGQATTILTALKRQKQNERR